MGDGAATKLSAGHRLGDYELLCPIAEGGMATVWIARLLRKRGFEKLVAIKAILPKFAEDEQFQEMFLDEARLASRIEHPNVANIHDLGEQDGVLYLVMEYIDGHALTLLRKTLRAKKVPFPLPIAVRTLADACAGLHAAHELHGNDGAPLGVVHRDVSPHNILVSTLGVSKVIDFGVAKAANRSATRTSTGYVKGKLHYMAPEQALSKTVDRRADVWGVGAVLYHLVTGRYALDAENQLALLNRLQREEPPDALPASTPDAIAKILERTLAHDPADRFQTADELRAALEDSGHIASHRDVATCVLDHLGAEAEKRRSVIHLARVLAEARADLESDAEDDAAPTTPHTRAPVARDDGTVRRAATAVLSIPGGTPRSLRAVPPELDMTAKMVIPMPAVQPPPPPSSRLMAPIEGPDLMSRPGFATHSGIANLPPPLETTDLLSRTGTTNAGVASGGSYGRVSALPTPPPAPAPGKPLPPWLIALAAGAGVIFVAMIVLIAQQVKSSGHAARPDADAPLVETPPPSVVAVTPPPLVETAPLATEEPIPIATDASVIAPVVGPKQPSAVELARAASLRGDAPAVRRALEARVRRGSATPEEANMVKQACKSMQDRRCVDDVKRLYPDL